MTEKIIEKAKDMFGQVDVMADCCKGSNPLKVSPCFIEKKRIWMSWFSINCTNSIKQYYPIYYSEDKSTLDFDKILII